MFVLFPSTSSFLPRYMCQFHKNPVDITKQNTLIPHFIGFRGMYCFQEQKRDNVLDMGLVSPRVNF